jgi:hypothetical protein
MRVPLLSYRLSVNRGQWKPVEGLQIGRFAVRLNFVGGVNRKRDPGGNTHAVRAYAVDHVPSGLLVADFDAFDKAVAFADDISRFSAHDPSSSSHVALVNELGPDIVRWTRDCIEADRAIPYRTWLHAASASVAA